MAVNFSGLIKPTGKIMAGTGKPESVFPPYGFWMNTPGLDTTDLKIFYHDGGSGSQVKIRVNTGQLPWVGDPNGFQAWDTEYDTAKFVGITGVDGDGFVSFPNVKGIIYDVTHASGRYYCEMELKGTPVVDYVGIANTNAGATSHMTIISGGGTTWRNLGYRVNNNAVLSPKWHDTAYQKDGDIWSMYVDFDTNQISMKLSGVDDTTYNYI